MGFLSKRRNKIIEKKIKNAFLLNGELHDTNIYWEAFERFAQEHGGRTDKHADGGQDTAFTYSIYDVIAVRDRLDGTACIKVSLSEELDKPLSKFLNTITTYYDDDQIESEYHYLDNKKHGEFVSYYQNGQTQHKGYCEYGLDIGKTTWWYSNGQLKAEHEYKDGILKKEKNYHYRNGHIETEINYKKYSNGDNLKFGKWIEYYKNGHKKIEGKYTKDKKNGKWTEWNKKGQIKSEENYKNDLKDGVCCTWYENGQKSKEENYKFGKLNGKFLEWYENGKKLTIGNYLDGKKEGDWTHLWEDGCPRFTLWKDDKDITLDDFLEV